MFYNESMYSKLGASYLDVQTQVSVFKTIEAYWMMFASRRIHCGRILAATIVKSWTNI